VLHKLLERQRATLMQAEDVPRERGGAGSALKDYRQPRHPAVQSEVERVRLCLRRFSSTLCQWQDQQVFTVKKLKNSKHRQYLDAQS
jgi:hypothetical protein